MLELDNNTFPTNILMALKPHFQAVDSDITVLLRPIRKGDPIQSWALTAALWTPDQDSWEFIGGNAMSGPTVNQYLIGIQCFNQDMDEERGLQVSSNMAAIARNLLSRSPAVRASIAALESVGLGYTERVTRFYVQGQRFLSNEIETTFYHLSNLEFLVETQTY